ncbi:hypothetical protein ACIKT0_19215, partial [Hansschlegelia beijingensis]|uniref:hypothetical protein n=1 Tax=Hansschlegelia beijingensis TaxID=1133344 RepID=UPI00387F1121
MKRIPATMLDLATRARRQDDRPRLAARDGADIETVASLKAELAAAKERLRERESRLREAGRLVGGALSAA